MPDEPEKPRRQSFANAAKAGARYERLKARYKAEAAARQAAEAERDQLKAKPTPEDVVKERDTLKAQIRATKHKTAFELAAKAAKVRPEALEDLWELSKLDTSSDEPDAKVIETTLAEKVKARPYLIDGGSTAPANAPAKLSAGPGSQRGASVQSAGMTVTRAQLRDPEFMRHNQANIGKAYSEETLSIVD